jgi:hypothetical protein
MLLRLIGVCLMAGLLPAQQAVAQQAKVPLATFSGTVHGVSSKRITIENAEGNLVEFEFDRKMRVLRDKKQIHVTDLSTGDTVTIEARQVMARFLIAVTITAQPTAKTEP